MKQDWVVWLGCALLFCVGAVWGAVPTSINFFKVKDIHDLFEIFSSAATIIAVCLAFIGVSAWRQQVRGEADHALARRVAVAALKYKETSKIAFNDAQFAVTQFHFGIDELPEGLLERYIVPMENRLKENHNSKAEFLAILLEVRAIWGKEFAEKYEGLLSFTDDLYGCLRSFFRWVHVIDGEHNVEMYANSLQRYYALFEQNEWLIKTGSQISEFDDLTAGADEALQRKLLRSC
ncbi:hypothetical protein PS865_04837 [Pseudomonas fluorescens]|uniref:hypothetical protein n=1 Tax=Pseudomonas fluorescens TaxID=294 RepID=UPI00124298F7|nr:hypothetical protein [Pseudomonas fluorescens]VVP40617.1 hypothetical protein PS865_04837 [Pseudomonas fluorescens]